jgi:hypothetical protein
MDHTIISVPKNGFVVFYLILVKNEESVSVIILA